MRNDIFQTLDRLLTGGPAHGPGRDEPRAGVHHQHEVLHLGPRPWETFIQIYVYLLPGFRIFCLFRIIDVFRFTARRIKVTRGTSFLFDFTNIFYIFAKEVARNVLDHTI